MCHFEDVGLLSTCLPRRCSCFWVTIHSTCLFVSPCLGGRGVNSDAAIMSASSLIAWVFFFSVHYDVKWSTAASCTCSPCLPLSMLRKGLSCSFPGWPLLLWMFLMCLFVCSVGSSLVCLSRHDARSEYFLCVVWLGQTRVWFSSALQLTRTLCCCKLYPSNFSRVYGASPGGSPSTLLTLQ